MRKEVEISLRMTLEMKSQLASEAKHRGEAEAVIMREALREYFEIKDEKLKKGTVGSTVYPPHRRSTKPERPELNEP